MRQQKPIQWGMKMILSPCDLMKTQAGMGALAPEKRGFHVLVQLNKTESPRVYWAGPMRPIRPINTLPHTHEGAHIRARTRVHMRKNFIGLYGLIGLSQCLRGFHKSKGAA